MLQLITSLFFRILLLLNKRKLEKLKEKWWNLNPARQQCEKQDNQSDGISIHNIGKQNIINKTEEKKNYNYLLIISLDIIRWCIYCYIRWDWIGMHHVSF